MSERPTIVDLRIVGVGAARLVRADVASLTYRAPHETWGHDVDVEVLPGSRGEAARERFAREQRALGRLASVDGVVPLLEAGVTVDGDLYLMTPTLGGRTLAEIIGAEGPMAWPEAIRIIEAAAATLHHAHVVGVTHRRIGPDTIVLADDGRVLITGLGSAGLTMDADVASLPAVDRLGFSAPELSSASPAAAEDAAGGDRTAVPDPVDAGPAGDIYGLGATLWALLAGRPPFTAVDGGDDEPATMIQRAATQRVGDLRSVAPASVAEAVEWATTIEPERRPSSAATFARALREAAARATSGFIADPDAVVAGWQPLRDPEEIGAAGPAATAGVAALDPGGAGARSGPAAAVTAAGFDAATTPVDPMRPGADALAAGAARNVPDRPGVDAGTVDDTSEGAEDGRRAGLLVGLGIAAIALVALTASAVLVVFVGDGEPVTISGPSIEAGEDDVPAEVLGVEVEAEPGAPTDEVTAGTGRDGATGTDAADDLADGSGAADDDVDESTGQSAVIEPFVIPTPTPVIAALPAVETDNAAPAGPTQPPARPAATTTATPGTIISAPPPPRSPQATPTPQTVISAPPAPAPTSSPTPMPTIAPAPTAAPVTPTTTPTPMAEDPTATPGPLEVGVDPT